MTDGRRSDPGGNDSALEGAIEPRSGEFEVTDSAAAPVPSNGLSPP